MNLRVRYERFPKRVGDELFVDIINDEQIILDFEEQLGQAYYVEEYFSVLKKLLDFCDKKEIIDYREKLLNEKKIYYDISCKINKGLYNQENYTRTEAKIYAAKRLHSLLGYSFFDELLTNTEDEDFLNNALKSIHTEPEYIWFFSQVKSKKESRAKKIKAQDFLQKSEDVQEEEIQAIKNFFVESRVNKKEMEECIPTYIFNFFQHARDVTTKPRGSCEYELYEKEKIISFHNHIIQLFSILKALDVQIVFDDVFQSKFYAEVDLLINEYISLKETEEEEKVTFHLREETDMMPIFSMMNTFLHCDDVKKSFGDMSQFYKKIRSFYKKIAWDLKNLEEMQKIFDIQLESNFFTEEEMENVLVKGIATILLRDTTSIHGGRKYYTPTWLMHSSIDKKKQEVEDFYVSAQRMFQTEIQRVANQKIWDRLLVEEDSIEYFPIFASILEEQPNFSQKGIANYLLQNGITPDIFDRIRNTQKDVFDQFCIDGGSFQEWFFSQPMVMTLERLLKQYPPSANAAHNNWNQINFLLKESGCDFFSTDREKSKRDSNALERYIQDIGMNNSPVLFSIYRALFQARTNDDIPPDIQKQLSDFDIQLKKSSGAWRFPNPKQILNELKKAKNTFINNLIEGKIPPNIFSDVGVELLQNLKTTSCWERGHDTKRLIQDQLEYQKQNPGHHIHAGFEKATIFVQKEIPGKNIKEGLESFLQEKKGDIDLFYTPFAKAFQLSIVDESLFTTLFQEYQKMYLQDNQGEVVQKSEKQLVCMMEKMVTVGLRNDTEKELFLQLSVEHLLLCVKKTQWYAELEKYFSTIEENPSISQVEFFSLFLKEYFLEHYLHQNEEHSEHTVFSGKLLQTIKQCWQYQDEKNVFSIENIIQLFEKKKQELRIQSNKKTPVQMIPSVGLLRVYAGSIGSACYTKQEPLLAQGQFPNVTAWIYTTGSEENIRLQGSLLAIESKTTPPDEEIPVLIARANNPKENFITLFNPKDFVKQSLLEVIATARRMRENRTNQKKQIVAVALGTFSGQCATNRTSIMDAYLKMFSAAPVIGCESTPDTNFNNYTIWDPNSDHRSVKIWEIDENGNEVWYGSWGD